MGNFDSREFVKKQLNHPVRIANTRFLITAGLGRAQAYRQGLMRPRRWALLQNRLRWQQKTSRLPFFSVIVDLFHEFNGTDRKRCFRNTEIIKPLRLSSLWPYKCFSGRNTEPRKGDYVYRYGVRFAGGSVATVFRFELKLDKPEGFRTVQNLERAAFEEDRWFSA